ncbi:hypothetical protein [Asanoa siamensis]|uniref:Alpha/beta hydrolase family protein n=1 Tax=Asanoa siamensis TaxID=926357 RepID=A0ABQ4CQ36_9ACTN|nr:hypothetical protein [Asanoa siamensis]GIF73386.1 hypothetical protein Asi02nite_29040 [Asanoa siamensis]
MTRILCVHGRDQHGKDPVRLRDSWAAGLNFGLTAAGRKPIDPDRIAFPFYGDVLERSRLRAVQAGTSLVIESIDALPVDPLMPAEIAEVESDLLGSMAAEIDGTEGTDEQVEEGILRIPGARRLLRLIADRTRVDQTIIESFLPDVAVYFKVARQEVLDVVRASLPPGDEPLVILGHSLGGLVVHDLLRDAAVRARTRLLVTLGSPLGLDACFRNLLAGGAAHPGVPDWLAVYDRDDFVALGHPLLGRYGPELVDLQVDNPAGKAHSITHYLGHEPVATRIADAVS